MLEKVGGWGAPPGFFFCKDDLKVYLSDGRGQFLGSGRGVQIECCKDSRGVTQDGLSFAGMGPFRRFGQLHSGKSS